MEPSYNVRLTIEKSHSDFHRVICDSTEDCLMLRQHFYGNPVQFRYRVCVSLILDGRVYRLSLLNANRLSASNFCTAPHSILDIVLSRTPTHKYTYACVCDSTCRCVSERDREGGTIQKGRCVSAGHWLHSHLDIVLARVFLQHPLLLPLSIHFVRPSLSPLLSVCC